jgi:hypothetical protein
VRPARETIVPKGKEKGRQAASIHKEKEKMNPYKAVMKISWKEKHCDGRGYFVCGLRRYPGAGSEI